MKTLLTFLFLAIAASFCNAQWAQTSGPPDASGRVNCFLSDGTRVFCGIGLNGMEYGARGLFVTSNNGAHWTSTGFLSTSVNCLSIVGSSLFAGTDSGVFISTDNGLSWRGSNTGMSNLNVRSFLVNGSNIYAGAGGVVYLSSNGGASWSPVWTLYAHYFNTLVSVGRYLIAQTGGGIVIRTTNNGATWEGAGPAGVRTNAMIVFEGELLVGSGISNIERGVYRSTDYGTSWTPVNVELKVGSLFASGTTLYAGTYTGVYFSTNGGLNWNSAGFGAMATSFGKSGTNLFVGTDARGVFRSTDNGLGWAPASSGLVTSGPTRAVGTIGTSLFAATWVDVYLSTDVGTSWSATWLGLSWWEHPVCMATLNSSVFVGTYGVYRTTDSGTNWLRTNLTNGLVTTLVAKGSKLFAHCVLPEPIASQWLVGVYVTTDHGLTWSAANSGLTDSSQVHDIAVAGSSLFAATSVGVFKTTDDGINWSLVGLAGKRVSRIGACSNGVGGTNVFAAADSVYVSTNNGGNWTPANYGLPQYSVSRFVAHENNLFAGGRNGVFLTKNNGLSWRQVNEGLLDTVVLSLAVNGSNLFVGSSKSGVWRRPLSEIITTVRSKAPVPTVFVLEQNYPNPFNPTTTIKYQIPISNRQLGFGASDLGFVSLKVFDILGREVVTLVNEVQGAGFKKVEFDAGNLASGVYLYRLEVGGFVATKKMLVVR